MKSIKEEKVILKWKKVEIKRLHRLENLVKFQSQIVAHRGGKADRRVKFIVM